jgi:hypothetical protein
VSLTHLTRLLLCACFDVKCFSYSTLQGHDDYQYSDQFSKQQHQRQQLQQQQQQRQHHTAQSAAATVSKLSHSHEQHSLVGQYPLYMTAAAQHDEYSSTGEYTRSQQRQQQQQQQQQQWNGSSSTIGSTSILHGVTRHQEGMILADASTAAGVPPLQQQQQHRSSTAGSSSSTRVPWTAPNSFDDSYGQVRYVICYDTCYALSYWQC